MYTHQTHTHVLTHSLTRIIVFIMACDTKLFNIIMCLFRYIIWETVVSLLSPSYGTAHI